MSGRVRLGAVAYLNARPLVEGLGQAAEAIELVDRVPSALADELAAGRLDIGLLPVIELARIPDLEIVPGLAIGSRGPARSVLLVARRPVTELASVALDPDSRTTNALVQVLLRTVWGVEPACAIGPADLSSALASYDAALRIGDKALFEPVPAGCTVHDLGEVWTAATGLPFVYAVWAARPGVVDRALYRRLHDARRAGLRARERIAREYVWNGRSDPALALAYLTGNIHYGLGSTELRGLTTFWDAAARCGLIERAPRPVFALERLTACHGAP